MFNCNSSSQTKISSPDSHQENWTTPQNIYPWNAYTSFPEKAWKSVNYENVEGELQFKKFDIVNHSYSTKSPYEHIHKLSVSESMSRYGQPYMQFSPQTFGPWKYV
jgi:hypothetical protein